MLHERADAVGTPRGATGEIGREWASFSVSAASISPHSHPARRLVRWCGLCSQQAGELIRAGRAAGLIRTTVT
jgi:hypothetical protein